MIQIINKDHPVFRSEAYLKDLVPFALMEFIKECPKLLVSDGSSFIVGNTGQQFPTWVWTEENISGENLRRLGVWFCGEYSSRDFAYFVAKPPVAAFLTENFIRGKNAKVLRRVSMESFECEQVMIPDKISLVERPKESDLEQLAECSAAFVQECLDQRCSREEALMKARTDIESGTCRIIRLNGRVIAMAKIVRENERNQCIGGVYTRPESRGKGYASAVVAQLTVDILESGKIPALYTDLSNPASNKAYTNVGFVQKGKVDEVKLSF